MGRTFDGKFVVATFYPSSAYKRGYLYQLVQWCSGYMSPPLASMKRPVVQVAASFKSV